MVNATIRDLRTSELAWQVTLGISALAAIALNLTGLTFRVEFAPNAVIAVTSYFFITLYYRLLKPDALLARMLIGLGQLIVVMLTGALLTYAASAVPFPYRDAELQAIDQWFGFERVAYLAFMNEHETLRKLFEFAYGSMMQQTTLIIAAAMIARRPDRLQAYVIAFGLALTATALIALFVPASSALIYVDKIPLDAADLPNSFSLLEALRAGSLRVVSLNALDGLITFPSFHTANAILFVWAFWSIPVARYFILLLNVLLIASTPLCGAHYVIDVVGGAVVAIGAIYVTSRLLDVTPHHALVRDAHGRGEPGHGEIARSLRAAE